MKVLLFLWAVAVCCAEPVTFSVESSRGQTFHDLPSSVGQMIHSPSPGGEGGDTKKEPEITTLSADATATTTIKPEPTTQPTEKPTETTKEETKEINKTPGNQITTISKNEETVLPTIVEKAPEAKEPMAVTTTEKPGDPEVTTLQMKATTKPIQTEPMPTPLAVAAEPASDKVTENEKQVETTNSSPVTTLKVEPKAEEAPVGSTTTAATATTTAAPTATTTAARVEKTTAIVEATTKAGSVSGNNTKTTKKPGNSASLTGSNLFLLCFTILFKYLH